MQCKTSVLLSGLKLNISFSSLILIVKASLAIIKLHKLNTLKQSVGHFIQKESCKKDGMKIKLTQRNEIDECSEK